MAIFYPMLWLRGLVLAVGTLLGGILMLVFLALFGFKLFGNPEHLGWWGVAVVGAASLSVFVLVEFYDTVLLKLNPTGSELTLYR